MAVIKHHKFVAVLPATLEANSIYYVRVGAGFDIYVTNSSGTLIAYPLNPSVQQTLHVRDEKPTGTDGGTFTSGADRTRDLNTVVTNTITGASLLGNQVTLPSGTYDIEAYATAYQVAASKARLTTSAGTVLLVGSSAYGGVNTAANVASFVRGRLVLGSTTVIELRHQCGTTSATNGFGRAASIAGAVEVYSDLQIKKV